MPREKTFNFIPETQLKSSSHAFQHHVSITRLAVMVFSKGAVEEYGLIGKYIKFYADPTKKTIAWTIFDRGTQGDLVGLRELKAYKNGIVQTSIGRLLKSIDVKPKGSMNKLPVFEYNDLLEKKTYCYVELKGY